MAESHPTPAHWFNPAQLHPSQGVQHRIPAKAALLLGTSYSTHTLRRRGEDQD